MDKKKKRAPRRKWKLVPSLDLAEHVVDNLLAPDDSSTRAVSPESGNHGSPRSTRSRSGRSDRSRTETGCETPAKSDLSLNTLSRAIQDEAGVTHCSEVVGGVDGLDKSNYERGNERENGNYDPVAEPAEHEGEEKQTPIIQRVHTHALVTEKEQLIIQLQETKEALSAEKETSESLRDRISYLQEQNEQNAERYCLEVAMQAEIDKLSAENGRLQGLVGTQSEVEWLSSENAELQRLGSTQMEQLTAKINRLAAENEVLQSKVDSSQADIMRLTTENVELQILVSTRGETEQLTADVQRLEAEKAELQSLVSIEGEIECWRVENAELHRVAANREDEIKRLEEESRQMRAKMTALEKGMQQLERKASVRAHIGEDLASATAVHSTKRWEGWSVKDPLAIAAAIAEESHLQKLAVAQTIEKLLEENDQLIRKVNEQAAVISDLNLSLKCKPIANSPRTNKLKRENIEPRFGADSRPEAEYANRDANGHNLDEISHHKEELIVKRFEESLAEVESPVRDVITKDYPLVVPMQSPNYTSAREQEIVVLEEHPLIVPVQPPNYITAPEQEIVELIVPIESTPAMHPSTNVQSEQYKSGPPAGSKLIKAPFRFLSFVAGYISGEDLIRN